MSVGIVQDLDVPLVKKEPLLFCMMIDLQAQRGLYVSKTFLWLWNEILCEREFLMPSSRNAFYDTFFNFYKDFRTGLYEVETALTITSLIEVK